MANHGPDCTCSACAARRFIDKGERATHGETRDEWRERTSGGGQGRRSGGSGRRSGPPIAKNPANQAFINEQWEKAQALKEQEREQRKAQRKREWEDRRTRVQQQSDRLGTYAVNAFHQAMTSARTEQYRDSNVRVTVKNNWNRDSHTWTTDIIVAPRDRSIKQHLHIVFDEWGNEIVNEWRDNH